jgi:hypothetical protein
MLSRARMELESFSPLSFPRSSMNSSERRRAPETDRLLRGSESSEIQEWKEIQKRSLACTNVPMLIDSKNVLELDYLGLEWIGELGPYGIILFIRCPSNIDQVRQLIPQILRGFLWDHITLANTCSTTH